ncbi:MAG: DNA gyrase inhibitor YacG [Steroidobacteraceae bacterium]
MVRCPTCGRPHEWSTDNPWRPFCSDRCRLIDLGAWLEEKRGIPSEPAAESEAEPQPFVPHPQH